MDLIVASACLRRVRVAALLSAGVRRQHVVLDAQQEQAFTDARDRDGSGR
ncbi:MAG: hypothetical protein ACI970_001473, partial [Myxococcota bacterium]